MTKPFKPVQNAEPARWLVERLITFGEDVLSIVPSGFEAYARVFHPASKVTCTSDGAATSTSELLRWSEAAALTGRTAHRTMQWASLRGSSPVIHDEGVLKVGDIWVREPEMGTLPLNVARALWPVLASHTQTRDRCFFAVWEGFGGMPRFICKAPAFEVPARKFHLFEALLWTIEQSFCIGADPGDTSHGVGVVIEMADDPAEMPSPEKLREMLSSVEIQEQLRALLAEMPVPYQSANLWWPEDRAWCVATEIDFNTTYVGGTQRLVDALLACEELEVYQVEPTDGVTYDSDTLNPSPDDPYGGSFKIR